VAGLGGGFLTSRPQPPPATQRNSHTELRDRAAQIKLQIDALDRNHDESSEIALKAFELSQSLMDKWVTADCAAKRQILEILCLNLRLDDVTLVPTMRKPFDMLAEGLISKDSRGERIRTSDFLLPKPSRWRRDLGKSSIKRYSRCGLPQRLPEMLPRSDNR